jgi:hypothetical protein
VKLPAVGAPVTVSVCSAWSGRPIGTTRTRSAFVLPSTVFVIALLEPESVVKVAVTGAPNEPAAPVAEVLYVTVAEKLAV